MAYRILVEPAAERRLRTFLPHVVQGLGRHLAELLEASTSDGIALAGSNGGPRFLTLDVGGVGVSCRVDGRDETLTILDVQERPGPHAASGETGAAAATAI